MDRTTCSNPWGNTFDGKKVVYAANAGAQSADVGSFPEGASWVGALDMSGNVWEWTSSFEERGGGDFNTHVARGASWYTEVTDDLRVDMVIFVNPTYTLDVIGLRCARD